MKALILVLCLTLTGCCSWCPHKIVYVKTYNQIDIKMPPRPVLISNGGATFNEIGKNAETDLIDLKSYAIQLEGLLEDVKAKQGQPIQNNK